ncbi:MAG TPA: tetratricopeptide repeat protein [Burkholderiales bacterium]|nr:tetratricopeptide repeat protein [Burkholderiales bacterium]
MSLLDRRDVPVSTQNRDSLARYEAAADQFHSYFGDPLATIDDALAADPHFIMGHCLRAGMVLTATDKRALPLARESVKAAESWSHGANDRERGHIAAALAWLAGDLEEAVERYGAILHDHPRDLLALQIAHLGEFFLGRSTLLRDRVAQVLPHWSAATPGYGYVLGMHAFGLEETGLYDRAEATGRRALDLNRRDPWAVHAVTHVMEMQGRLAEGIAWLTSRETDWAPDNAFAYHNWWHLALYHLDLGDTARVLEIYDSHIRPRSSEVVLEMIDATAMLWRLHLRGIPVGDRWRELASAWEPLAEDAYYAFNDAHAMMAFVADGRAAAAVRLLAALERAAQGEGTNAGMTRDVALPLAYALAAFGAGDYEAAVSQLSRVRPVAIRFGGSHAQRDVIALTLVEAALRAGRAQLARALAAERTDLKPASPFNWSLTGRALVATGDMDGAAAARRTAEALCRPSSGSRLPRNRAAMA